MRKPLVRGLDSFLESAGGGTIVDDIDSLSSAVQAKLLHAVEHRHKKDGSAANPERPLWPGWSSPASAISKMRWHTGYFAPISTIGSTS